MQQKYDYNAQRVQNEIDKIIQSVEQFDISDQKKQSIINTFVNIPMERINNLEINYSLDSETNRIINYLYRSFNEIIENVINEE